MTTWSGEITPTGTMLSALTMTVSAEVPGRERVAQIAHIIGKERMNEREISVERGFKQIGLAVCFDLLLPLFDCRADARGGEDAAEAIPAAADALDESALRDEFDLQFARMHLSLRFRIQADVAGDQLAHQLRDDKLPNTLFRGAGVIGDDSQVAFSLPDDLIHDPLRRSDGDKAANHKARAIGDHGDRFFEGDGFHGGPPAG